ncbi:MAG TPA: MBL fold metallo-hydrolase, partial [Micromonosporaceae bacterium]
MRVEPDTIHSDPTVRPHWTGPGVFQVVPGIFRIPLPLPFDGLRAVNVYAVVDDGGLVLVDSGWAVTEARELLEKALAALGAGLPDVRRFLVTHVHRDHYNMAVLVRREFGAAVALGAGERATLDLLCDPGHRLMDNHWAVLARCGAGELVEPLRQRAQQYPHDPSDWAPPDDWLGGGADIALAGRTLQVVETPGHTRGHVIFVDAAAGLMFAGDHVLPHITPSIGYEPAPSALPLGDYLHSLR